jgi:hypothetical protein
LSAVADIVLFDQGFDLNHLAFQVQQLLPGSLVLCPPVLVVIPEAKLFMFWDVVYGYFICSHVALVCQIVATKIDGAFGDIDAIFDLVQVLRERAVALEGGGGIMDNVFDMRIDFGSARARIWSRISRVSPTASGAAGGGCGVRGGDG